jgi:hypothetical protein
MLTEQESLHLSQKGVATQSAFKDMLTEEELCIIFHVSRETILKSKRDPIDPIPCHKFKRRYLYDLAEVLRWTKRSAERALRPYRKIP